MFHDHLDVVWGKAVLAEGNTIIGSSLGSGLGWLDGWLGLSELLGLLHLHLAVEILELELTEDGVGVVKVENFWVANDEDEAISLLKGDPGDTGHLLHADLHESLSALLLVSIELVLAFWLVLELWHLLFIVVLGVLVLGVGDNGLWLWLWLFLLRSLLLWSLFLWFLFLWLLLLWFFLLWFFWLRLFSWSWLLSLSFLALLAFLLAHF